MHVESVAWVAERKDVLSTAFWLLAMLSYVRQTRRGVMRWAGATTAFMALGLLAKPMLVTLPLALLILDYWPLGRLRASTTAGWTGNTVPERSGRGAGGRGDLVRRSWPLVLEKAPLFALSLASGIVTFIAQRSGGAVQDVQNVPLSYRLSNACLSCMRYLVALVWPHGMAVYYPYPPGGPPPGLVALSVVALVAISALAWRYRARLPYLVAGWLWFLVTLAPVIGLVQVGGQSMADRYTYVPYFGLFVIVVWGAAEALEARRAPASVAAAVTVAPLLLLGFVAHRQASLWRDSRTLFEHALSVTRDNAAIEYNLGVALGHQGLTDQAASHFAEAVRIWPEFTQAQLNLGVAQAAAGRLDDAAATYARVLSLRPDSAQAEAGLGGVLAQMGHLEDARPHLARAASLDPADARALTNLGLVELRRGDTARALEHLERAAALDPRSPEAANNLGLALLVAGRAAEAASRFERALALDPSYANARQNLERARQSLGASGPAR
jgi:Tfp pilus assembly protein PilF